MPENSENLEFDIGFWHPFGDHADESAKAIIKRKQDEIKRNGWTLWSFGSRTWDTMDAWFNEIKRQGPGRVVVFCSDPKHSQNTKSSKANCNYYIPADTKERRKIPAEIEVPHPMGNRTRASAFKVKRVYIPDEGHKILVDWFNSREKQWGIKRMKMRGGEHLIKPGKGKTPRKYYAILELEYPYLAEVGIDPDTSASS